MKTEDGEKYDNYLTKLQNICTDSVGEEGKPVHQQDAGGIKTNLALPALPTAT
jgi:hypothetical protein